MIKWENQDVIRVHLYATTVAYSYKLFPSGKTQPRICYALPDSKGAEGANINFISHTNHSFIWLYLFDNAHTAADIAIFWAE